MAAVTAMLAEPTAEGVALRVDVALRPGGRAGALSRSLGATLAYYERESATWERQAMIKARPVAGASRPRAGVRGGRRRRSCTRPSSRRPRSTTCGARRCGSRSTSGSEARSSSRSSGGAAASATSSSRSSCCRSCTGAATRGCGPRTPSPPSRALAIEGYVADADAEALADAYRFLRRVEHRLQIVRDLQTHDLPPDRQRAHDPRSLARARRRRRAGRAVRSDDRASSARSTSGSSTGRCSRPSPVRRHAPRPRHRPRRPPRSCSAASGSPSPRRSYDVLGRLVDPSRAHREGAGPPVPGDGAGARALAGARRGARAAGTRRRGRRRRDVPIADLLATDPVGRAPPRPRGRRQLVRDRPAGGRPVPDPRPLRHAVGWPRPTRPATSSTPSRARRGASSRRARRARRSRAVAVRVIREAVDAAEPDLPFAVIGMGKLGARELNVASDLDLVFVYDGEGADALKRAAGQLAERVLRRDPRGRMGARRRPPSGGPQRSSRAIDRRLPRVLGALRRDVGVPDAAAGPGDRRRPRPRPALRAERRRFRLPARRHHDRPRRRHPPHARTDRARAREAARGGEVPLQARDRVARRRPVRGGGLADATRWGAPRDPFAPHAGGDRPARRGEAAEGVGRPRSRARPSCSAPT